MSGTVLEATRELMRRLGLTTVFGNPGTTEVPFLPTGRTTSATSWGCRSPSWWRWPTRYSQLTRPSGAGEPALRGRGRARPRRLFTASANRSPLIVIGRAAGPRAARRGAVPRGAGRGGVPAPVREVGDEPAHAGDVPAALARAYRIARTPPYGPVFVSVPVDDWERPSEARTSPRRRPGLAAHPEDVAAVDRAAQRTRPGAAGAAGDRRRGRRRRRRRGRGAVALAERIRAGGVGAPMSARCSFPEDHPLFAGFLAPERARLCGTSWRRTTWSSCSGRPRSPTTCSGRGTWLRCRRLSSSPTTRTCWPGPRTGAGVLASPELRCCAGCSTAVPTSDGPRRERGTGAPPRRRTGRRADRRIRLRDAGRRAAGRHRRGRGGAEPPRGAARPPADPVDRRRVPDRRPAGRSVTASRPRRRGDRPPGPPGDRRARRRLGDVRHPGAVVGGARAGARRVRDPGQRRVRRGAPARRAGGRRQAARHPARGDGLRRAGPVDGRRRPPRGRPVRARRRPTRGARRARADAAAVPVAGEAPAPY